MSFKESRTMTVIQRPAVKRASHSRERSPVHPRAQGPPPQPPHPLTAAGRLGRLCFLPPALAIGGLAPHHLHHVQRSSSVWFYCDFHRTFKSSVSSCVTVFFVSYSNPAGLSPNSASLESWYHSQWVVDLNPFVGICVSMIMYFFVYWI